MRNIEREKARVGEKERKREKERVSLQSWLHVASIDLLRGAGFAKEPQSLVVKSSPAIDPPLSHGIALSSS